MNVGLSTLSLLVVLNKRKNKIMENRLSKELEDDNAIRIIKKVYQALLLVKERLADVVYASEDQWGEYKLKRTLDDIDELCKKYPWLRELDRGYMTASFW